MESTSKNAKMASSSSLSLLDNLPNQILMEIFSRLPMRTLMATRCVCKSWLFLTSDTDFAKLHSTRAPTEILCLHNYPNDRDFSTDLALGEFELRNDFVVKAHFNFTFHLPRFDVRPDNSVDFGEPSPVSLVNSCHGLICYRGVSNRFAVIWNPIMGQFTTVPAPRREGNVLYCTNYGFGFSPKAKKFKLLRMLKLSGPVTGRLTSFEDLAQVLTFEEGAIAWRHVCYCSGLSVEAMPGVFLEGAIHWVNKNHNSFDDVVVSFDFDSENFRNVPLPSQLDETDKKRVIIDVFEGCLSLTISTLGCIHVWVMKEYGVQDSWTKTFSLRREPRVYFQLLKYLDNGELLMLRNTGCLVACHPARERYRSLGRAPSRELETIAYTPSLFRMEDAMMRNHVYTLNVKSRPVLKLCRRLITYDRADPKEYWRLNEGSSAGHLASQERSKALSLNKKKKSSEVVRILREWLANYGKGLMCFPVTGEEGQKSLKRMGLVQSPVPVRHNAMETLWEELMKKWKEQKELVQRFQQNKPRIEELIEQIKQITESDEGGDETR